MVISNFKRSFAPMLLAAFSMLAIGQAQGSPGPLTPVKYQIASIPGGIDAPVYLAKMRGLYEKEGLDVQIVPGRTSQDTINSLIAGAATLGSSLGINVILSADKGQRVVAVGARYGKNVFGVVVGKDSNIHTIGDLTKRNIIVPGASYENVLKMVLKKNGVDPATNHYIMVPNPGAMVSSYASGQSDGAVTVVPWALPRVDAKRASRGLLFADFGVPEPGYVYIATPETLKNHPDIVRKFLHATYEASRLLHTDPKLAGDATVKFVPGADAATSIAQFEAAVPFECSDAEKGKPYGPQSLSDWQETVRIYKELGLVTTDVNPASLFSNAAFEPSSEVSVEKCPA